MRCLYRSPPLSKDGGGVPLSCLPGHHPTWRRLWRWRDSNPRPNAFSLSHHKGWLCSRIAGQGTPGKLSTPVGVGSFIVCCLLLSLSSERSDDLQAALPMSSLYPPVAYSFPSSGFGGHWVEVTCQYPCPLSFHH